MQFISLLMNIKEFNELIVFMELKIDLQINEIIKNIMSAETSMENYK